MEGYQARSAENPDAPLELYDLEKDISEKNNVAGEYPKVVARIESIMLEARSRPIKKFQFGRYPEKKSQ